MTDEKRPPRFTPLVDPRPKEPANRAILHEHQRALTQRQSDHEVKVNQDLAGIATYLARRETAERQEAERRANFERDVATSVALVAGELEIAERLPPTLQATVQSLTPPSLPKALAKRKAPSATPVHVSARKSSEAANASYLTLALLVLEFALEIARHL
jgi:hypothetical protein